MTQTFESWAIVELFGRNIIAGKVSDQVIGGQGFVRIDVPPVDGQDAYTKFYGPGALYCITPTDEVTARAAAEGMRVKPVDVWKLNLPAPAPERSSALAQDFEDDAQDDETTF
jgi:hypothetical protein